MPPNVYAGDNQDQLLKFYIQRLANVTALLRNTEAPVWVDSHHRTRGSFQACPYHFPLMLLLSQLTRVMPRHHLIWVLN